MYEPLRASIIFMVTCSVLFVGSLCGGIAYAGTSSEQITPLQFKDKWFGFVTDSGKSKIAFPAEYIARYNTFGMGEGELVSSLYISSTFMFTYTIYPEDSARKGNLNETAVNAMLAIPYSKVLEQKDIKYKKYIGKALVVQYEAEGLIVFCHMILAGSIQYQMVVMVTANNLQETEFLKKDITRFFKSFKYTG